MQMVVEGPRGGQLDNSLTAYTMLAVKSFAKQLKINRKKFTVVVKLHHKSVINDTVEGEVEPLSDRAFIIDVCLYGNWLSTLAHEMVHVKQFVNHELDATLTRWKSNRYCDNIDYWDQPWEKEARRLQNKLVQEFDSF